MHAASTDSGDQPPHLAPAHHRAGPDPAPTPDLVRRKFDHGRPNVAWFSDITYLATGQGWGASGGVGTFAGQIAAMHGAHITAVCGPDATDLVRSLGAEHVVDYTTEDFARSGRRYDMILDLAGSHSVSSLRKQLTRDGTLVLCAGNGGRWLGPVGRIISAHLMSPFVKQRLQTVLARPSGQDLATLKKLIDSGRLRPVIDKTYPLAEAADAIRHVEEGHPPGGRSSSPCSQTYQ